MRSKTYYRILKIIFAVSAVSGGTAFAHPNAPETLSVSSLTDTVIIHGSRSKAERREIRKKRNTVEFTGKFELSQTQFENWAAGGENTFSGRAAVFFRHQYQYHKLGLDYKCEARYGMNHIDKRTFKNEDEFKANFTTSWIIHKNWSYAGTSNLRSQFTNGCRSRMDKTKVSAFMAPGFFDVAVGFTYKKAPFNIVLSPVGGSAVFVLDDDLTEKGMNGVPKGCRSRWQVGPSAKICFDKTFAKNVVRVRSEAYSFTNIRTTPTVRWETTVEIRAAKYLVTTLYSNLNYDKDAKTVNPDQIQYKYSIGVGMAYIFKNK